MIQPQISVIIGAYNVAAYIKRAIDSALNQIGVDCEVIVVDDGSSDQTSAIIASIGDERLKSLRLNGNQGPSAARNAGIAIAQGKWLAILDGDDAFEPDRLQRLLQLAEASHADIVVDNLTVVSELGESPYAMFPPQQLAELKRIDLCSLMHGNARTGAKGYPLACTKPMFSAAFLRNHQLSYSPELRVGEDYFILAEALASGALCVIDQRCGYRYTRRRTSISFRISAASWKVMLEYEQKLQERYLLRGAELAEWKRRINFTRRMYWYQVAVEAFKQKDLFRAFRAIYECPAALWEFREPLLNRLK